jgi:NADPH:quinone reductase-like Zn-dependent oxidoreductase
VIAVASLANHELVRSLGADIALDYRDGDLRPVVTWEYPLEQVAAAHHELDRRHTSGKLVLAIR